MCFNCRICCTRGAHLFLAVCTPGNNTHQICQDPHRSHSDLHRSHNYIRHRCVLESLAERKNRRLGTAHHLRSTEPIKYVRAGITHTIWLHSLIVLVSRGLVYSQGQ